METNASDKPHRIDFTTSGRPAAANPYPWGGVHGGDSFPEEKRIVTQTRRPCCWPPPDPTGGTTVSEVSQGQPCDQQRPAPGPPSSLFRRCAIRPGEPSQRRVTPRGLGADHSPESSEQALLREQGHRSCKRSGLGANDNRLQPHGLLPPANADENGVGTPYPWTCCGDRGSMVRLSSDRWRGGNDDGDDDDDAILSSPWPPMCHHPLSESPHLPVRHRSREIRQGHDRAGTTAALATGLDRMGAGLKGENEPIT